MTSMARAFPRFASIRTRPSFRDDEAGAAA
jgi:hypothetical protein